LLFLTSEIIGFLSASAIIDRILWTINMCNIFAVTKDRKAFQSF
jgi:hypothetical protein